MPIRRKRKIGKIGLHTSADFEDPKSDMLESKYLPDTGEGDTKANQAVTACTKLIFKYFNDGDVFDTRAGFGWANDISSYANWLYEYTTDTIANILRRVFNISSTADYVDNVLYPLFKEVFDEHYLAMLDKEEKIDSIYECKGPFKYNTSYLI